ncbi:MAG: Eco57I restriction-modification methylase domain-containing protein [Candidatus Syntrophosphaera sp.]|jgi:hypothetical protein|nr:Eco57I restriction-modification methylase domain-containing protein [Candidatus Syntrophosphaera sp.]
MEINANIVLSKNFSPENWITYFETSSEAFIEKHDDLTQYADEFFSNITTLGSLEFDDGAKCGIFMLQVSGILTERSSRIKQLKIAQDIITGQRSQAGIFIFYDESHSFRLSLVYPIYKGTKRSFSNYRRHSFYVSASLANKTYLQQLNKHQANTMAQLKDIFSVDKVSDEFYREFEKEYALLQQGIKNSFDMDVDDELRGNFALLFVIRVIFLGFVQKKGWLGDNENFIRDYVRAYDPEIHQRGIYQDLLTPLFFTALNQAPSQKNKSGFPHIPEPFKSHLVSAPYLNGGLFRTHEDYDTEALFITDSAIKGFLDFLFSYNFTLEENTLYDVELELNPEFLGIIFEKLINKAHGAIYTPRLEVDFMCRLSLVKYLQQNCLTSISLENLYKLFFPEYGNDGERTLGDFTEPEANDLLDKLETVTVCDPAIGSGAFAVGMLNVIDEIENSIHEHFKPDKPLGSGYERKKRIIFQSLYGVEVKQWAVWITQLRLWITLLIEADDDFKHSEEPLLPSFDFKIRQGDSLIQLLGSSLFPVSGEGIIAADIKRKINELMKLKTQYYNNKCPQQLHEIERQHKNLYTSILDKQKKELNLKISRMKGGPAKEVQSSFLDTDIQNEIDFASKTQKNEIRELEYQVAKLNYELNQMNTKSLPFTWRIDFPEIFMEKGGFDIVVGNPPYVAQEQIDDPLGLIKKNKDYKDLLKEMVNQDFPRDIPSISGKSDLYTFFYIRGIKLLNDKGILTYICSNSWLDVEFGAWLQKFLLERCQIHYVIDSLAKRVFKEAKINTVITLIGARQKIVRNDDLIRFVAFKLPFENSLYLENFQLIESSNQRTDIDDLRINPVSREQLSKEGWDNSEENKYKGSKWGGIYIKAPNIYFTIMEKAREKLVKLGDIAKVERGFTSGANSFFYMKNDNKLISRIGDEYWHKIIRSSSHLNSIEVSDDDIHYNVLLLNEANYPSDNAELKEYIEWGETNGFDKRPTTQGRTKWFFLPEQEVSDFVQGQIINDRFIYSRNQKYLADCVLNLVYLNDEYKAYSDQALVSLNSSFNAFMTELNGRTALGDGALKNQVFEVSNLLIVDPKLITDKDIKAIISQMSKRKVMGIFHELGVDRNSADFCRVNPLPDRKALDDIVFKTLGFSDKDIGELYLGLLTLTSNRLTKAKAFKTN